MVNSPAVLNRTVRAECHARNAISKTLSHNFPRAGEREAAAVERILSCCLSAPRGRGPESGGGGGAEAGGGRVEEGGERRGTRTPGWIGKLEGLRASRQQVFGHQMPRSDHTRSALLIYLFVFG